MWFKRCTRGTRFSSVKRLRMRSLLGTQSPRWRCIQTRSVHSSPRHTTKDVITDMRLKQLLPGTVDAIGGPWNGQFTKKHYIIWIQQTPIYAHGIIVWLQSVTWFLNETVVSLWHAPKQFGFGCFKHLPNGTKDLAGNGWTPYCRIKLRINANSMMILRN